MTRYEELIAAVENASDAARLHEVLSDTIEALKADRIMPVEATKIAKAVDARMRPSKKAAKKRKA